MDENVIKMREFIYSLIDVKPQMSILDIGCGSGYDLGRISERVDRNSSLYGLDLSEKSILAAKKEYNSDPRFRFLYGDTSNAIDFDKDTFDVVFSSNMLECITDKHFLIKEVHRVLKPGGQVVFAHYDWDSQLFDGDDKELVRKIVRTYNDWKQGWMTDLDAWMGRRLWRAFQKSGLFQNGRIETYVLTNTKFEEPFFGYMRVQDFGSMVKRNMISEKEYSLFFDDVKKLAAQEQYFYSINMYVYVGIK